MKRQSFPQLFSMARERKTMRSSFKVVVTNNLYQRPFSEFACSGI